MSGTVTIEVPAGELIDRLTILDIKAERITDPAQRANVEAERAALQAARERAIPPHPDLPRLSEALRAANEALWDIEDRIRACEAAGDFGAEFVALARAVYRTNDRRAALKREISLALGSRLIEEKSYKPY
ncbi:hypothetical protein H0I76_04500 [Limibaculum sp. M0105]|uniref:Uncharacterized protein n=1 Tax=Thermohalobaculum xanthum TaxID=2753746 RepID=A0A8J7M6I9_9RHOB|nr:DUF6165 family protein [Thermohalobaculum xanthum]MBK0398439.1 hypothetical protein [Thermohalobaculum xanthum]